MLPKRYGILRGWPTGGGQYYAPGSSSWILATGAWRDIGVWSDMDFWRDA